MDVLFWRELHILGAVLLLGVGFGSAFHLWFANRSAEASVVAEVARAVVWADLVFIAPAVVLQPVTGLVLATGLGHSIDSDWILAAAGLYVIAGACWLTVVGIQLRIAKLAKSDAISGRPLGHDARRLLKTWFWLGWPTFGAVLVIIHLMVYRPADWLSGWPL